jgi:hypothetical protein
MNLLPIFAAFMLTTIATVTAAETDTRVFEMRTYYAAPGRLDDLHARFRDHTTKLFAKHGMTNIGYWTPIENTENKLIYVLAYPSREARDAAWKEFNADPDWQAARKASEAHGKIVARTESRFFSATDFSPAIEPSAGTPPRTFELRTYTTTPENLPLLFSRFRDHTTALFARHGMTNFAYWTPIAGQKDAGITLIYLLAHPSEEAAKKAWDAFRADPEWIAAKQASEEKAGGSLTLPDGMQSVFLQPTDYSPTR